MKAVGYRASLPISDASALVDLELPVPEPGPRDLRVAVRAVSVNPVDTKVRQRAAPADGQARILGFDAVGTVDAVGPEVTLFRPGDEVFYAGVINRPGTNAEYHLVDERIVGRKPATLSDAEAAALPLTAITAWELLFDRLRVPYGVKAPNGTLLVIGGAGGVGSILIQLARRLTGLTVVATASRPETIDWCLRMGAHHVIDHRENLLAGLKAAGVGAASYIAALTGSDRHQAGMLEAIAPQGAIAIIDDPKTLDFVPFKAKSASIHWELMFTRAIHQTPDMIEQHRLLCEVADLADAGVLRTTLTQEIGPITAANLMRAHALVESGTSIGKAVLAGWP